MKHLWRRKEFRIALGAAATVAVLIFLLVRFWNPLSLLVFDLLGYQRQVLFSEVRGVVTGEKEPLAGVEIRQEVEWSWNRQKFVQTTHTDDKGSFILPKIEMAEWGARNPQLKHQLEQKIFIRTVEINFEGWVATKLDLKDQSELGGREIKLDCEITDPRLTTEFPNAGPHFYGICRLQGAPPEAKAVDLTAAPAMFEKPPKDSGTSAPSMFNEDGSPKNVPPSN